MNEVMGCLTDRLMFYYYKFLQEENEVGVILNDDVPSHSSIILNFCTALDHSCCFKLQTLKCKAMTIIIL